MTVLANHSILSNDEYVVQFLKFRETIAVFKSSRTIITEEESNNFQLTVELEQQIPSDFDDKLSFMKDTILNQCEKFNQISHLLEKYSKRLEESSRDSFLLGNILKSAFKATDCSDTRCNTCYKVEHHCGEISDTLERVCTCLVDEVIIVNENQKFKTTFLQSIKIFRDTLVGFQLLLVRRDAQLQNLDIQSTTKRINTNKNRLVEATTKGAPIKEIERLKSIIGQDEVEIEYQQVRHGHIRFFLFQELKELHKYRVKFLETLEEGCQNFVNHYSDQLQVSNY